MRVATATQLLYGIGAVAVVGALRFWRRFVFHLLVIWGGAVVATGLLAPVVYTGRPIAVGLAVGAATTLVVGVVLWARPNPPPESGRLV